MATDKNSFIAYVDWGDIFEALPDDKAGQLAKHLWSYVKDKNPTSDDPLINATFAPMKSALKRDLKKYSIYIEKQRLNGAKGGRPKKPTQNEKNQAFLEKPKKADSVNVSVNDNVSVNEKELNNEPNGSCNLPTNSPKQEKVNYSVLLDYFNERRNNMPKVIKLTEARKKAIRLRVKEYDKNTVGLVIRKASNSKFLNGINKNDWVADFDWIMKPANFTKILEGNYDEKTIKLSDEPLAF